MKRCAAAGGIAGYYAASGGLGEESGMEALRTVDELCVEHRLDVKQLAEKAGLDEQRVTAIVLGRWTPSPQEREKIAAVFGIAREQIAWGHKTPIQHIYGHGPA